MVTQLGYIFQGIGIIYRNNHQKLFYGRNHNPTKNNNQHHSRNDRNTVGYFFQGIGMKYRTISENYFPICSQLLQLQVEVEFIVSDPDIILYPGQKRYSPTPR